jgi:hypothetical protein
MPGRVLPSQSESRRTCLPLLASRARGFQHLVASSTMTPPAEDGDPLEGCPEIRLPRDTATARIDIDRGEAQGSSTPRVARRALCNGSTAGMSKIPLLANAATR